MKNKFWNVLETIKKYQSICAKIKEFDSRKQELSGEFTKKYDELIKKFNIEGVWLNDDDFISKSFDEIVQFIEYKVQEKVNSMNSSIDYDEDMLKDYFNSEISEEERKNYSSYENFKDTLLQNEMKEREIHKKNIINLLSQVKELRGLKDIDDRKQEKLEQDRIELLNERINMLENELKNCDIQLIENGVKYNENGFPLISDQIPLVNSDPQIDEHNFSIDDLAMVHLTRYFPVNGVISSAIDAGVDVSRKTIHTSLNGSVSSHLGGNWDDCSIIILDPLKNHIDQVACVWSVDTFTYGSMKLSPDAMILIDNKKFNEIYSQNKEYIDANRDRFLVFDGEKSIVVNNLLSLLGYPPQKIGGWSWENQENADILNNYMKKNYPDKLVEPHSITTYSQIEDFDATLHSMNIDYNGNDMVIDLELLYSLRKNKSNLTLEQFIKQSGIYVMDNEIHLSGIKERLFNQQQVSPFQIQKIALLLKKYELIHAKKVYTENDGTHYKR